MNFPTRIGIDSDGFILNQTSLNKIQQLYKQPIQDLIQSLKKILGVKLHSAYIYGSVGRGEAIVGKSDLDFSIVVNEPVSTEEYRRLNQITENLLYRYKWISKIDFDPGTIDEILNPANLYSWGFWLKHLCSCVEGEDLSIHFPKQQPSARIGAALNKDLQSTLLRYKSLNQKRIMTKSQQVSALKRIIRGAYCTVIEQDQSWTNNLEETLCILEFYYPQEKLFTTIKSLLVNQENLSAEKLEHLLNYFHSWFNRRL